MGHFFQRRHSLAGRIPVCRGTGNLKGAGAVKPGNGRNCHFRFHSDKRVQRNHFAVVAADKEEPHILDIITVLGLGLHNYFPGTAEVIEVIHFHTAQKCLQRSEHAGYRNVQGFRFFAVDVEFITRGIRVKRGIRDSDFRTLVGFHDKLLSVRIHLLNGVTGQIHDIHTQGTGTGQTRQRRLVKGHDIHFRRLGCQGVGALDQFERTGRTFVILFHHHRDDTGAGFRCIAQNIKTVNGHYISDARQFTQLSGEIFHLLHAPVGRCTFRQIVGNDIHALIFIRHITGRSNFKQKAGQNTNNQQTAHHQLGIADALAHLSRVFRQGIGIPHIKPVNHFTDKSFIGFFTCRAGMGLQQLRTKGRGQRQRNHGGQHHGNRNGQGELFVQLAGRTAHERNRHKHGCQHAGNGHNRTGHFFHGPVGSFFRRQAGFLNVMFHGFHYNDSVIYYQTDSQNHGKHGQGVNGKP